MNKKELGVSTLKQLKVVFTNKYYYTVHVIDNIRILTVGLVAIEAHAGNLFKCKCIFNDIRSHEPRLQTTVVLFLP